MAPTYRAAVIGLGRMGHTYDDERVAGGPVYLPYCHTPSYAASQRTELVAGADPHEGQREIYAERWGLRGHVHADHREMLAKEKPDIVSICTSARARCQIIEDVARSGARAIWAEKPIALSLEEADRIVAVCEENDVTIAFNCARRWHPRFIAARELIDEGEIGEILQVTGYFICGLSHNGSHGIDAMRYLAADANVSWVLGEIESDEVAASEADPQGNGYLAFDSGARGYFRSNDCGPASGREFDVMGTEGRIRLLESQQQYELWKSVPTGPVGAMQPALVPYRFPLHMQGMGLTIIDDILDSAERGGKPRCGAVDARAALEVAIGLRESHRRGFCRVDLPHENRSLGIVSAEVPGDDLPARVRREQART